MTTLTVTLRAAKAHGACKDAYKAMHKALGLGWPLDSPFPLLRVLEERGLADTLWATQCVPPEQEGEKRRVVSLWLADILERVEHKMQHETSRAIIPLLREHAISPVSAQRWQQARNAAYYDYAAAHANAAAYTATYHTSADAPAAAHAAAHAATNATDERWWQTERMRHYLTEAAQRYEQEKVTP